MKWSMMLLAGLMLWPAGITAQTTSEEHNADVDPDKIFDFLDFGSHSGNMTVTAQVRLDGVVLDNKALVAVYAGDEIRGKDRPVYDEIYGNILWLTIIGTGSEPLVFKVYTEGNIIEVDQGLVFKNDGSVGDIDAPYYIDLPAPITSNLTKEGYATTCLPFNARIPDGVTAFCAKDLSDGKLALEKITGSVLPKETGLLVKAKAGTESIAWCATVTEPTAAITENKFVGTLEPKDVEAKSVLTLGYTTKDGEQKLGFWCYTGTAIAANRAYIAEFTAGSRGVSFDDLTLTAIAEVPFTDATDTSVYDLQGRRVSVQGPGLYIRNGRKYIVR
jgi:hypothetical protein